MRNVAIAVAREPDTDRWLDWLRDHVDRQWLPGQWFHSIWFYSGLPDDPTNTVRACQTESCDARMSKGFLCGIFQGG
jgi:hypothetical protein